MPKTLTALFLASTALLAMAPVGEAFHGCPYYGEGPAQLVVTDAYAADPGPLLASVYWGGRDWCPTFGDETIYGDEFTYTVEIWDALSGQVLVSDTFAGEETIPAEIVSCEEIVAPYTGWDEEEGLTFNLVGYQANDLCTSQGHMTYAGTYQVDGGPLYTFEVVVNRHI